MAISVKGSAFKVGDLPVKEHFVTIGVDSKFQEAVNVLVKNNILSAPVVKGGGGGGITVGDVVGHLDLVDLMVFIVHLSKKSQEVFVGLGLVPEHQTVDFSDLHVDKSIEELFKAYDVSGSIANFSQRNPLSIITLDQPLSDLFSTLVKHHRVLVFDSSQNLKNIITQSDLIKFIYKNKGLLADLGKRTVEDLNLGTYNGLVRVTEFQQVVEAFKQVAIKGVSAVAVVDKDDHLVGDIEPHDMSNINAEGDILDKILSPCKDYLQNFKKHSPITVKSTDNLDSVVDLLEKNATHRVWVVDDTNKVKGVISLGDVLGILIK